MKRRKRLKKDRNFFNLLTEPLNSLVPRANFITVGKKAIER